MCGRFTLSVSAQQLSAWLGIPFAPIPPRYNIAPTQGVLAVRQPTAKEPPRVDLLHWGLIPFWAKDAKIAVKTINARVETAAEKPTFRAAFRYRRAAIPADGFFEWQATAGRKQPVYFHRADGRPFAFAGLWESWSGPAGEEIDSCTILTTAANDLVRPYHDRMPIVLADDAIRAWIDPSVQSARDAAAFLRIDTGGFLVHPVGPHVNNPRLDVPACIAEETPRA